MNVKRSLLVLAIVLFNSALFADIKFFWLDRPSARNNPHDPGSPLYRSPTPVGTPTFTTIPTPTFTTGVVATSTFTSVVTPTPTSTVVAGNQVLWDDYEASCWTPSPAAWMYAQWNQGTTTGTLSSGSTVPAGGGAHSLQDAINYGAVGDIAEMTVNSAYGGTGAGGAVAVTSVASAGTGELSYWIRSTTPITMNVYIKDAAGKQTKWSGATLTVPANTWTNLLLPFTAGNWDASLGTVDFTQIQNIIFDSIGTVTGATTVNLDNVTFKPAAVVPTPTATTVVAGTSVLWDDYEASCWAPTPAGWMYAQWNQGSTTGTISSGATVPAGGGAHSLQDAINFAAVGDIAETTVNSAYGSGGAGGPVAVTAAATASSGQLSFWVYATAPITMGVYVKDATHQTKWVGTGITLTANTWTQVALPFNAANWDGVLSTVDFTQLKNIIFDAVGTATGACNLSIDNVTFQSTVTATATPTVGGPTNTFTTVPTATFTVSGPTDTFTTVPTATFTVAGPTNTFTPVPTDTFTTVPTATPTVSSATVVFDDYEAGCWQPTPAGWMYAQWNQGTTTGAITAGSTVPAGGGSFSLQNTINYGTVGDISEVTVNSAYGAGGAGGPVAVTSVASTSSGQLTFWVYATAPISMGVYVKDGTGKQSKWAGAALSVPAATWTQLSLPFTAANWDASLSTVDFTQIKNIIFDEVGTATGADTVSIDNVIFKP